MDWDRLPATSMPRRGIDADCEPGPAPEACVWALGADAVVWGTLVDVRLERFPAVTGYTGGPSGLLYSCDSGIVSPALVLDIAVDEVIAGDAPTGVLSVRVGTGQLGEYDPVPHFGDDDSVVWLDGSLRNPGGPLVVGQPIGAAIHRVEEHDLWSLMGEALFGVGIEPAETRVLAFQRHDGFCESPVPTDVPGLSLAQAELILSACAPSAESEARRRLMEGWYGSSPERAFAGVCF